MVQFSHLGARTHWRADHWLPVVAPSRFREPLHRAIAREMDREDILRIVRDFGEAARRCREGGLDGLEVLAHGHLAEFWSPHYNQRTDDFGGSLRNRCRFGLMVFEEMRRQAGDDYIMGIRTAMGEGFEGGLSDDECLEINRIFQDFGLIDFFNVNYGRIDTAIGMASGMPGMQLGLSPNLVRAGKFKREVKLPVFHACRITDMATARHAIRDGLVDMIGMTRAHIADPHIVNRIRVRKKNASAPASARPTARGSAAASTTPRSGARRNCRTRWSRASQAQGCGYRRRPRRAGGRARRGAARPRGYAVRGGSPRRRPGAAGHHRTLPAAN